MRIEIERSGGFAGMLVHATIDTGTLPSEQAKELESLVSAAGFFELPARAAVPPSGADRFKYKITIKSGETKHTVETSDEAAPASLRPLLRRLTVLARSGGRP
ncbi:protealysin inhibitor emfourin [Chloroflexota bacterium]